MGVLPALYSQVMHWHRLDSPLTYPHRRYTFAPLGGLAAAYNSDMVDLSLNTHPMGPAGEARGDLAGSGAPSSDMAGGVGTGGVTLATVLAAFGAGLIEARFNFKSQICNFRFAGCGEVPSLRVHVAVPVRRLVEPVAPRQRRRPVAPPPAADVVLADPAITSGGGSRTRNLVGMNHASYHCSTPRCRFVRRHRFAVAFAVSQHTGVPNGLLCFTPGHPPPEPRNRPHRKQRW